MNSEEMDMIPQKRLPSWTITCSLPRHRSMQARESELPSSVWGRRDRSWRRNSA